MDHKTFCTSGSAKLIVDMELDNKLEMYFKFVRPSCVKPGADINKFFILPFSKEIVKSQPLEKFMENVLKLQIPSSTLVRKIVTTVAATKLSDRENTLINDQLSHQRAVANKYYAATKGKANAAEAFQIMESLRQEGESSTLTLLPSPSQDLIQRGYQSWSKSDTVTLNSFISMLRWWASQFIKFIILIKFRDSLELASIYFRPLNSQYLVVRLNILTLISISQYQNPISQYLKAKSQYFSIFFCFQNNQKKKKNKHRVILKIF